MSRRLTKQACVELRDQLSDLGYGQAEGETPELFARRLYPIPEHLRALDPNVVLVIGPRGSGKSELFNAFFKSEELGEAALRRAPRTARLRIQPSSTTWKPAYPGRTAFPDNRALARHVQSDETAKTLWYVMLVRSLAEEIDGDLKSSLSALMEPMAADLASVLAAEQELSASPTAALDALEQRLEREDRWIFMGYDELVPVR